MIDSHPAQPSDMLDLDEVLGSANTSATLTEQGRGPQTTRGRGEAGLRALLSEVLAAGEEAKRLYHLGAGKRATQKPDRSPVTEADRSVEARLRDFCHKRFPHLAFVGEEEGESLDNGSPAAASTPSGTKYRMIVDPIDGTRAFLRGLESWSVLCGVERVSASGEKKSVLGIAYMPVREELFVGVLGHGASCNGRPLQVSAVPTVGDALICHGGLEQFQGHMDILQRVADHSYTQRGFADFDGYRYVLLGKADAMIDPQTKPWDLCVPAILLEEAGGRFTDFTGAATHHGGHGLASNGLIHDELVALLP